METLAERHRRGAGCKRYRPSRIRGAFARRIRCDGVLPNVRRTRLEVRAGLQPACGRLAGTGGDAPRARRSSGRIGLRGPRDRRVRSTPCWRRSRWRVWPDLAVHGAEMADGFDPRAAAALLRGISLRPASDDFAADLDIPVLVVAGALDAAIPLAEARAVAEAFPRGRLIVCENSGHLPMLEEAEKVTAALTALVSE